jgi:hypothetical protein
LGAGGINPVSESGVVAPGTLPSHQSTPATPIGTTQSNAPQGSLSTEVNPNAPGNSISSSGQTVAVEGAELLEDGSTALDLAVTPSASPSGTRVRRGFTYEEELFRTKWGWAAYAEAQKVAAESQP